MSKLFTSVFIRNKENQVLLGHKARGFGVGLWNGFGGKVEKGENIKQSAVREVEEESHLLVCNLQQVGVMRLENEKDGWIGIIHVFTSSEFKGVEEPSEEMNPLKWFNTDGIPYSEMWPDASHWLPYVLDRKFFFCDMLFDKEMQMKKVDVTRCDSLEEALMMLNN